MNRNDQFIDFLDGILTSLSEAYTAGECHSMNDRILWQMRNRIEDKRNDLQAEVDAHAEAMSKLPFQSTSDLAIEAARADYDRSIEEQLAGLFCGGEWWTASYQPRAEAA